MTRGPHLARVLRASTDRYGQVWLTVQLSDGAAVDLELEAVPRELKQRFVAERSLGALGGAPSIDRQAEALIADLRQQGYGWVWTRVRELNDLDALLHEVERRAGFGGRTDILAMAGRRRAELRQVRDALYEISAHLWPEETARGPATGLGVIPAALIWPATLLVGLAIVAASTLVAYYLKLLSEERMWRAALAATPPDQRADLVRDRFGGSSDWLDDAVSAAKAITLVVAGGYVGMKVIPWALERLSERRAAA